MRRPGLTLIELLVVIAILAALFTLGVLFVPRVQEREKVARGADRVQGALLISKQRALRDRAPSGVRLIPDPANPALIRRLEYVQQPDDFSGGLCNGTPGGAASTTVNFSGVDFTGGGLATNLAPVQPGDYLEVFGGGLVHLITAVSGPTSLTLARPLAATPTSNYRVIRQPRILAGEQPVDVPPEVAIDLSPTPPLDVAAGSIPTRTVGGVPVREILFSPAGAVVGQGTASDRIILWVRDTTLPSPLEGGPRLITVYVRTGFIASHPVDYSGTDPFSFTKDGRSSGL